jgi:hypothetical protein
MDLVGEKKPPELDSGDIDQHLGATEKLDGSSSCASVYEANVSRKRMRG